jgi:MFS family permease
MMPMSRLSPRLTARFGTRSVCATGLVLVGVGLAILAQLGTDTPYLLMAAGLLVLGVGMGAAMTPATSAITEALPSSQQGVGSALNDLSREVGGALGIAVIGSLLTGVYSSHVDVAGLPEQLATKVRGSFAIAAHLPAPIPAYAHEAFTTALNVALLTAAGAAFVAAVSVVVVLRRRHSVPATASRAQTITR